ncbi:Pectinesterase inhibitor domain containing protein [Parasponia andersonii]|uniref:Pectinesterase n=1 Tax=Parasponia andersonii TaxID=3476 RepID=A0A2P5CUV8_PARAD|nr:Pectinesterase inhibitor domain containing protein [Parasponia andersonii]
MSGAKVTVAGVSIILVVGVVIALIAGVSHKSGSGSPSDGKEELSTSSKAVAAICRPTDYKQACVESLGAAADNATASPKDLIQAAINSTIRHVVEAMQKSSTLAQNSTTAPQKMSLEDCKDLLDFAADELQASFSTVGDSDLHTVHDREAELMNWLSAVVSYQQTCLDGIQEPELKTEMSNNLMDASKLTSNALAIVSAISNILGAFKIPINFTNPTSSFSRRLLEASEDDRSYPSWFSAADRKLLATRGGGNMAPNAVVAKDGSGHFKTIAAALAAYPKNHRGRYVIYVKAGIYDEYITVTKDQVNVFMYGDGPRKTIVTGRKNFRDGVSTFKTASFSAVGNGFIAKSMGFQNTAGPEGHQAVALRVQSDMAAFYNCRMDGYQDTLYTQAHRQFYRNCVISGTVDFIFGDASAVIQNSLIIVRKPAEGQKNAVTAQGRADKRETTGIVIQNCRIVPEQKLYAERFRFPTYLGRPWKEYSRTVIMESTIGDLIQPAGWMEWNGNFALDTLQYREYGNRGPGAATNRRVRWRGYKVITDRNEALQYTPGPFLQGNLWLRYTGAPYFLGFKR